MPPILLRQLPPARTTTSAGCRSSAWRYKFTMLGNQRLAVGRSFLARPPNSRTFVLESQKMGRETKGKKKIDNPVYHSRQTVKPKIPSDRRISLWIYDRKRVPRSQTKQRMSPEELGDCRTRPQPPTSPPKHRLSPFIRPTRH